MKIIIIMWIRYLSDLSSEKMVYEGSLQDCQYDAMKFNIRQKQKEAHAGCNLEVKQPNYLEE